jgi:hypothetical protein
MVELGLFEPRPEGNGQTAPTDPLEVISRQKSVTADSLREFGAVVITPTTIQLPCYGPDGVPCTTFSISTKTGTRASKGLFAKGKPAGLFFPHVDGQVRLPQPGETWHLVEGPKDAAALHALGLLACGLNTCRLAPKFARLFRGVKLILIPDRDSAGEQGAQQTSRALRGVADSIRIAVLPAECKESDGADVRDILRQKDGPQLIRQSIEDAAAVAGESEDFERSASTQIEMPEGEPIELTVLSFKNKQQRRVVAERGEVNHRDNIDTNSGISRDRFIKKLAKKTGVELEILEPLVDSYLVQLGDHADEKLSLAAANGEEGESQATIVADMASQWDLWHTPGEEVFATVPMVQHEEIWPVASTKFKRYVARRFYVEQGEVLSRESLSAAIQLIEAMGLYEGPETEVHVRVAGHDGNIYVDLCNAKWQVVEITPTGWEVLDESPVRFRRSRGMLPLPDPERGGSVDLLRDFLNVDDTAWRLIVAWLLSSLCPRGPYPLLVLLAEQGSGKSTAGRLIRGLVDPNSAPLRFEHREPRELMIGASNSWCLAYDNLSYVPQWLSDALCRLSTGGGFATRELYTNQDEIIFDSQRPVLLTSIEDVATRSDLLDRCLMVRLPAIAETSRRREEDIERAFYEVQPKILGALFDAVSGALANLPQTHVESLPRMADFALWVTAAEQPLGWEPGTFMATYSGNRQSANDLALEASPVGQPLVELLQEHGCWSGTATKLLNALENRVSQQTVRAKAWPKNARVMSGLLKRVAPISARGRLGGRISSKIDREYLVFQSRGRVCVTIRVARWFGCVIAAECKAMQYAARRCHLSTQ